MLGRSAANAVDKTLKRIADKLSAEDMDLFIVYLMKDGCMGHQYNPPTSIANR